jgi:hypothetical protein
MLKNFKQENWNNNDVVHFHQIKNISSWQCEIWQDIEEWNSYPVCCMCELEISLWKWFVIVIHFVHRHFSFFWTCALLEVKGSVSFPNERFWELVTDQVHPFSVVTDSTLRWKHNLNVLVPFLLLITQYHGQNKI